MSRLNVSNFGLANHCEPCPLRSGSMSAGAHSMLIQPEKAKIVSSMPPQSMYETHIDRTIHNMNATALGLVSPVVAKASMTGYNSGVAKF